MKQCKNCGHKLDGYDPKCDTCGACLDAGIKCACDQKPREKDLLERLEYFCAGNYYSDIDAKELAEEYEDCQPADIEDRIEGDAQALNEFIHQLKEEKLI